MPFVLGYANYIKHDPYILDLRVERERERERGRREMAFERERSWSKSVNKLSSWVAIGFFVITSKSNIHLVNTQFGT